MFEKNQKKLNKNQYRTTHVKEKNILDLKEKLGWKGKGTSEDPIIINNTHGFKPKLWFHETNYHLILSNLSVYTLAFHNLQNVIVENCRIFSLEVEGCYNMIIRNNSINNIKLLFTRNSTITGNFISTESMERLNNNYYDRLQPIINKILIIILVSMTPLMFFPFLYGIFGWIATLAAIFLDLVIFFALRMWYRRESRTKNMANNFIAENMQLMNASQFYIEIVNSYSYLKYNYFINSLPWIIGIAIGLGISLPFLIPLFLN